MSDLEEIQSFEMVYDFSTSAFPKYLVYLIIKHKIKKYFILYFDKVYSEYIKRRFHKIFL